MWLLIKCIQVSNRAFFCNFFDIWFQFFCVLAAQSKQRNNECWKQWLLLLLFFIFCAFFVYLLFFFLVAKSMLIYHPRMFFFFWKKIALLNKNVHTLFFCEFARKKKIKNKKRQSNVWQPQNVFLFFVCMCVWQCPKDEASNFVPNVVDFVSWVRPQIGDISYFSYIDAFSASLLQNQGRYSGGIPTSIAMAMLDWICTSTFTGFPTMAPTTSPSNAPS